MTDQVTPEIRMQQIKLRRAEIAAFLAASKHEYVTTGIGRPFAERTALESEDADLTLEALRIGQVSVQAKAFRRILQNSSLLSQLLRLLDERGMWAIALEASQRADVALQELTPWKSAQASEEATTTTTGAK